MKYITILNNIFSKEKHIRSLMNDKVQRERPDLAAFVAVPLDKYDEWKSNLK